MREELIELINKYEIISFDIFDTLIFRNVFTPTDIFKILANYAKEKFEILDFFNIRIEAEKESRIERNNFESNIDEIYKIISQKINKKNIVLDLKKKELELELEFCVANPFMKEIFDFCIKEKKRIVLISDMYLKKDFLLNLLANNGYKNVELYVSCEIRKNKGSSELFQYVYDKNNFDKSLWLHIGDNAYGDYEIPKNFGIAAYQYSRVSSFTDLIPNTIIESILLAIQCNYLYNGKKIDYWDFFGVKYVSFLYFGFTKWLYDLTKDQDNLYFLARDGYIPNQIYQKFNSDNKVFTKYLYCSRKTIQIPSLILKEKDDLIKSLTQEVLQYNKMSLKEYLKNAQVDLESVDMDLIKAFGFSDFNDMVVSDNRNNAKKLVARLYDNIKENLLSDCELAKKYLNQEGMQNFDKINIMDIGWGGSIQEAISTLLNKEVVGYYFGTIDTQKHNAFTNMFGYYFDLDEPKLNKEKVFSNVMMYELIFSAPHGTSTGYQEENNCINPILSDDVHYNKIVEKFQSSALHIIDDYFKYLKYFDSLDKEFCLKSYQQFLETPTSEDLKEFSKLSNEFILGCDRQFSYVNKVSVKEIKESPEVFYEKVKNSLWMGTFYIEDASNLEKDYLEAKRCYNKLKYSEQALLPLKVAKIYLDCGSGFSEDNIIFVPYKSEGSMVKFELMIDKDIKGLRIDPIEGIKIRIKNLVINTDKGNANVYIPHKNYLRGKIGKCIYINSKDPKIILKNVDAIEWISFSAIIELV